MCLFCFVGGYIGNDVVWCVIVVVVGVGCGGIDCLKLFGVDEIVWCVIGLLF